MSISEKLTTIAENEQKVFDAGKKSQYDEFWDNFQNYGKRVRYPYAFSSLENTIYFWNETTFRPKYNISPKGQNDSMFRCMKIADFPSHLKKLGIEIDLSQVATFNDGFYYTSTEHLGTLDLSSCSSMNFAFFGCSAKTIDKLILRPGGTISVNNTFTNMMHLENITIEGTIRNNGFNFQHCKKLKLKSIKSIINALSSDTSDLTITFSKTAINNAFGINVEDETTYPEGSEYYTLRNSKSNWTFNYV